MPASTTHDDLTQLRSIADAATPGPWRCAGRDIVQLTDAGKGYPLDYYPDSKDVVIGSCASCGNTDVGIQRGDDAAFVAAARGAVPVLIDEVERLRSLEQRAFMAAARGTVPTLDVSTLLAALREALDLFDATWCAEHGHAPTAEQHARIAALRKLVTT